MSMPRAFFAAMLLALAACSSSPPPSEADLRPVSTPDYVIGPRDTLSVFVWRSPELSVTVPVRPDGKISMPLVQDIEATGHTPAELAHALEGRLQQYVQNPRVTVIVTNFVGPFSEQVRIIGEAQFPKAVPYVAGMSALDAMLDVNGLTKFAAGNRSVIVRRTANGQTTIPVALDSLIKDGDISSNVALRPGDILIIPRSYF